MLTKYLLLDLETVAADDAEQWLPPVEADKRLTDPAKIADDLAKKRAAQLESAPLDADLNRIIAAAWQKDDGRQHVVYIGSEDAERNILNVIWSMVSPSRPMVGYGLTWFDAGVLVRRSQLLGVVVPSAFYDQGKYRHPLIVELADRLTLNGMIEQKKGRGLEYHCQRLGIHVGDAYTGKDIAELYRAGNVEGIKSHALADITRIGLLAHRLSVIALPQERQEEVATGAF